MRSSLTIRFAVQSLILVPVALGGAQGRQTPAAAPLCSETRQEAEVRRDLARQLATRIVSLTGPRADIALTFKNASSLGANEASDARRALRAELRGDGVLLVGAQSATALVSVTLSENFEGLLWIAEVVSGKPPDATIRVAMVAAPRTASSEGARNTTEMTIHKTRLFAQNEPILDLALFDLRREPCGEDAQGPTLGTASRTPQPTARAGQRPDSRCTAPRFLVLSPTQVALYTYQEAGWKFDRAVPLESARPPARDPRGRLLIAPDRSFTAYLPGEVCNGTLQPALSASCREADDLWPLETRGAAPSGSTARAAFGANTNSFTGRFISNDGVERQAAPFISVASFPEKERTLWMFAGLDGRVQVYGGNLGPAGSINGWGDEMATVKSECGGGWQVLATRPSDFTEPDAIQANEIVNQEPVAVSPELEFDGPITALRPAEETTAAVAVSRNLKTGIYEAFSLSISCGR